MLAAPRSTVLGKLGIYSQIITIASVERSSGGNARDKDMNYSRREKPYRIFTASNGDSSSFQICELVKPSIVD